MSHFFKSIRIRNLLSFGPDSPELELKPINIVIGPNGSGKSNLLAAISLFCSQNDRNSIVQQGGGIKSWFWMENVNLPAFVHLEAHGIITRVTIDENFGVNAILKKNYDTLSPQELDDLKKRIKFYDAGDIRDEEDAYLNKLSLGDSLRKLFVLFRDWQYGPSAPVRSGPQPIDFSSYRLRDDGRNLAHVLKRIISDEKSHSVFMEFLSELYEDIEKIDFTEAEDYLFFFVIENGRKVPAARISDGTLRYLALLAILCDPEPPNLICLEEPEMGLHPDLIQVVAKAIRYASERTQIIATTHSVSLVDKFTDSPESIVVCEKIDGSTELRRLDPEEMAPWLEKYRLGDLWTSGQIGGNRW